VNARGNALAIVSSQALVTAGYVQDWRIELLVECLREGFTEPLEAWRRGSIFEGDYDHGSPGLGSSGSGGILGAERKAAEQGNDKGENNGAFHDKSIISAAETPHHARRWPGTGDTPVAP
jgi:hypothetical protein